MKIKKLQAIDFGRAFDILVEKSNNKTLVYRSLMNKAKISNEIEAIKQSYSKDSEEYKKYKEELNKIILKYGKKDEQGNVSINQRNGSFTLEDESKREESKKEIADLNEKYKEILNERNKEIETFNVMLNEEIEVDFIEFDYESFPDVLTDDIKLAMTVIIDLIKG